MKGSLEAMLALLEARVDGDALFFTRELIVIAGDTAAVVTLRNILDRETISVLDEASSLFGPLRRMARAADLSWERRADAVCATALAAAGGERRGGGERDAEAEPSCAREIEALKTRLSKLEARQRRKEGAAA